MEPFDWSSSSGLAGRRLVVTGAASGIGAAMTRAAMAAGCDVLAVDLNEEGLTRTIGEVSGEGRAVPCVADLGSEGSSRRVVDTGIAEFGGLDGMFHAAAVMRRQYDINSVTENDFDLQVAVNQRAPWFLARDVCEHLSSEGRPGSIVLISSLGAFTGGLGGSWVYASTKGAILVMVRSFARQYAANGIRVNGIAPGTVDTPMLTGDLKEGQLEQIVDGLVPLKRVADPLELANAGLFLLSDYASYITGVTLDVDGGWNCR